MTCFHTRTNIGTFSGRPQPSCASGAIAWWGRTSSRRGTCCQRLPGRTWGEPVEIGSIIASIIFQCLEKVRSVDVMIKNQQQFFHHAGCHWRAGSKAKPQTCECRLHGLEGFSLQRVRFPRTRHLSRDRSFKEFVLNNILSFQHCFLSQYFCRTSTYLVSSRLADTVGLPPVLGHLVVDQRDDVRSHRRPVNEPLE